MSKIDPSVELDGLQLFYCISTNDHYITTYTKTLHNVLDSYLDRIYYILLSFYNHEKIFHSNTCGNNVLYICKNLNLYVKQLGRIFITKWKPEPSKSVKKTIEEIYGPIGSTIGASYHALVYFELKLGDYNSTIYYGAIETTIDDSFIIQYYIGTSIQDLENILKVRYQCQSISITTELKKEWYEFI